MSAARAWAASVGRSHPEIVRIVLFGSYATGRAGVGSDLDLAIEVSTSERPFGERLPEVTGSGLPVAADILVFTSEELAEMLADGRRFARELEAGITLWRQG